MLRFHWTAGLRGLSNYAAGEFQTLNGHLESITLPDGNKVIYRYDAQLNPIQVLHSDATSTRYHYEDESYPNHLGGITERTGVRASTWRYNASGLAASSAHANGVEQLSLAYVQPAGASGRGYTRVINSLGQSSLYSWQRDEQKGSTLLLSSGGASCSTCPATGYQYTYTTDAQLATSTDAEGRQFLYDYDEQGRLIEQLERSPQGDERLHFRQAFEADSQQPTRVTRPSVNPDGELITEIDYNHDKQPVRITERGYAPQDDNLRFMPIERSTSMTYSEGKLIEIDGPRDDVDDITRFSYDQHQRLSSLSLPGGQTIAISRYDALGRPLEVRIGSQSPYTFEYNSRNRITRISHRGQTIHYRYDAEDRLNVLVDPYGKTTRIAYDDAGRPIQLIDDLGRITDWTYDTASRLIKATELGMDGMMVRSLSYAFAQSTGGAQPLFTSLIEQGSNPGTGQSITRQTDFQRDAMGRLSSATNRDTFATTTLSYNAFGELATLTEPGGQSTHLTRDGKGQPVALSDARDNTTQYRQDDFGRIVIESHPDTGIVRTTYDAAGNRLTRQSNNGEATHYRWDAANRLLEQRSPDGVIGNRYDPEHGRLLETQYPEGTETFDYNAEGELISHTRHIDNHSFTTRYTYDAFARVSRKTLPDGQVLRHHYHESGPNKGQLRAITRERLLGLNQTLLVGEIDQDPRDGNSGYLSHNGRRTQRSYSPDGSIASLEISDALVLQYTYDDNGHITGIDENGTLQSYGYAAGRLTSASTLNTSYTYRYDALGNRLSKTVSGPDDSEASEIYHYPAKGEGNRLLAITDAEGTETMQYEYNAQGSPLETKDGLRFEYNHEQRPVRVYQYDTLLAEYRYNSFGERIAKVVYAGNQRNVTYFLYDGHTLSAEIDGEGAFIAQYIYLTHQPVVRLAGNKTFAIHGDHLGTPRLISDDSGQSVWQADYSPFGEAHIVKQSFTFNLRLAGQYADVETGTHYNYYRDYDPAAGRYQTSDPIGLLGGINSYAYTGSNPLSFIDQLGLLSTEGISQQLYRRLVQAGVVAAADGPLLIGDTVAAVMITMALVDAGVSYFDPYQFKPSAISTDYYALIDQMQLYVPGYSVVASPAWTPDWDDLVDLSEELLEAQTRYIAAGQCSPNYRQDAYDSAVTAVDYGDQLAGMISSTQGSLTEWLEREFNDYRANGGEIEDIAAWVAAGMPRAQLGRQDVNRLPPGYGNLDALNRIATTPMVNGVSPVTRAIDKHAARAGSAFHQVAGSQADKNAAGRELVEEILNNPLSTYTTRETGRFGIVLDVVGPDGRGLRFSSSGQFIGLLEPPK
ncbi:MAG: RHS repeat-associated core domain-containing protein [Granulosicoccus sp.]